MKGFVHVYTGDGKGKTTAAFGLALRAAGTGIRVFIGQFVKGRDSGELRAVERLDDLITVRQYGRENFIYDSPGDEDIRQAREGLAEIRRVVTSGAYGLVILDEANVAVSHGLLHVGELLSVIDEKPEQVELVVTGRNAAPELIERADLVTEMRMVKHYFNRGVGGRPGIEK